MALDLAVVAAIADNGVIGRDNKLIWRLKSDLKRFRRLTMGKPLLMGRRTHESIGVPLPGRETIVLTSRRDYDGPGIHVAHSVGEGMALGEVLGQRMRADALMVIGGGRVFEETMALADRLYLTLVEAEPAGDVIFPAWDRLAFRETRRERHPAGADDEHAFTFLDLERRPGPPRR